MATSPLVFGCDTLSRQILDMYEDRRDKSFHKKMQIWRLVFVECWQTFGDCNVLPVGSTISGMGTDYSDLDLNLMIDGEVSEDRSIEMLETLLERWCDHPKFEEVSISELPSPIIRFEVDGVRAEIVIQENGGLDTESVRNTFLMMCYGDLDVRVRPLAVVLKRWASYNMLLGTMARRLSGFGLMLMLIFYLQQRHPHPDQVVDDSEDEADLEPPVLPCLQEKYPDLFHEKAKMFTHLDYIILERPLENEGCNFESLGTLLIGFFKYIGNFPFGNGKVISVRTGKILDRQDCLDYFKPKIKSNDLEFEVADGKNSFIKERDQWSTRYILIEEPFRRYNVAKCTNYLNMAAHIQRTFLESYITLSKTRDLSTIVQNEDN